MKQTPPYTVILDTNIWVAERLLRSALGNALLYAVAEAKATIGLPEIVEREVGRVLPELAEQAVRNIRRDVTILRQLSGHQMLVTAPSAVAIQQGIATRWSQLVGTIERVPFTLEQAQAALARIIERVPPCGENNEQFRDSCIWDAAVTLGADRVVHLVSSDNAFYEGRKWSNGLASFLRQELARESIELHLYPTLGEFLNAHRETAATIDQTVIEKAIVDSAIAPARAIASEKDSFDLGPPETLKINGYTTPRPALVAVSFEIKFPLERVAAKDEGQERENAELILIGECAYDPSQKSVSDIEIKSWTKRTRGALGWSRMKASEQMLQQYEKGHFRLIS